jgi:hypothetical protein
MTAKIGDEISCYKCRAKAIVTTTKQARYWACLPCLTEILKG